MTISYIYQFIFWPSERLESPKDQDKEKNSHENVQEQRDMKMFTKKIHEVYDCVLVS